MNPGLDAVAGFIKDHDDFLVAAHRNPDGDALGSCAALAHLLRGEGKQVRLYNASGVPRDLAWIDLGAPLVTCLGELGDFRPRAAILVDCGQPARVGGDAAPALEDGRCGPLAVIDHHLGEVARGAQAAFVEPQAASASLLVGRLAQAMQHPLTGALGEGVFLGLVADTGSFSFSNTNADAFAMARAIVEAGLDVGAFTERREQGWDLSRLRLWGDLAARIELAGDGAIAGLAVTDDLLAAYGEDARALEGFSSRMRSLRGVRLSILTRSDGAGKSKASLRSGPGMDARAVAATLGGGGHEHAAGVTAALDPRALLNALVQAALAMQNGGHA